MEGNSKHGATCKGQIPMPPYRVTTTYSVSSCTEVLRPRSIKANHYSVGENAGSEVAKAASDQHPCQWDRARSPSRFITGVLRTCMHFFFSHLSLGCSHLFLAARIVREKKNFTPLQLSHNWLGMLKAACRIPVVTLKGLNE